MEEDVILVCPECSSERVATTAEQMFMVNTGEHWCHSVKAHDGDAKATDPKGMMMQEPVMWISQKDLDRLKVTTVFRPLVSTFKPIGDGEVPLYTSPMQQFVYTLIRYRPDGVDTCRGCVMATSSSDFELDTFTDRSDLVSSWAKATVNAPDDPEFCTTEFTLLINGLDSGHLESEISSMERDHLFELVKVEIERLKVLKFEALRIEKEKKDQEKKDRLESLERKQLLALQEKYGK